MNFKKTISKVLCAVLCLSMTMPLTAHASDTYYATNTRGFKYLCWSKDTVNWTVSKEVITNASAWQEKSGILVNNLGVTRLSKSTSYKRYYNFKHELLAGAEYKGATLGWSHTLTDQCIINGSGNHLWQLDL